jgi:hypothetical protein
MKLIDVLPIFESRRNPTINIRTGIWKDLAPYMNDPDVYIHFAEHIPQYKEYEEQIINGKKKKVGIKPIYPEDNKPQLKLGINPNYPYNTPVGIYAYNLQDYVQRYNKQFLSFASFRPFIYVFRWNGKQKFQDMNNYSERDWNNDYLKLLRLYPNSEPIIADAIKQTNIVGPIGKLWNSTRILSGTGKKWGILLRNLGYSGFRDRENGAFSQFEYPQNLFLSKDVITDAKLLHKSNSNVEDNDYNRRLDMAIKHYYRMHNIPLPKDVSNIIKQYIPVIFTQDDYKKVTKPDRKEIQKRFDEYEFVKLLNNIRQLQQGLS